MVKEYLAGKFESTVGWLDPTIVATFYATDHYMTYKQDWKYWLDRGDPIVCDRYVDSNMYYTITNFDLTSFSHKDSSKELLEKLYNFEYGVLEMPIPDITIFLLAYPGFTQKLRDKRTGKTGGETGDIYEDNSVFLDYCYCNMLRYIKWLREYTKRTIIPIQCQNNQGLRSIDDIYAEIKEKIFQNSIGPLLGSNQ
jgi:dTMP kinase